MTDLEKIAKDFAVMARKKGWGSEKRQAATYLGFAMWRRSWDDSPDAKAELKRQADAFLRAST